VFETKKNAQGSLRKNFQRNFLREHDSKQLQRRGLTECSVVASLGSRPLSATAGSRCRSRSVFLLCVLGYFPSPCLGQTQDASVRVGGQHQCLQVAIKEIEPFVMDSRSPGHPEGLSIDLWDLLAQEMGYETNYLWTSTVPELLAAVESKAADVAIAAITITSEREQRLDLCHSYIRSGLRIAVPHDNRRNFSVVSGFFSSQILYALTFLLGLTFITANLLWFAERRKNSEAFPKRYFSGVGEAIWWSVATIITGGCENKAPETLFGRLVAVAWMIGSIVLVAFFTATLASEMTLSAVMSEVSGPNDLKGRRIATVRGTAVVEALQDLQARVVPCETLQNAFDACKSGDAVAVVYDAPTLEYRTKETRKPDFGLVGPLFHPQQYGIAVQEGSALREEINQALLALHESGKLRRLKIQWLGEAE